MKVKDIIKTIKPNTKFRIFTVNENYLNDRSETAMENTLFKSWSNAALKVNEFYNEDVLQIRPTSNNECGYYVLDIQVRDKRYGLYDVNKK